MNLRVSLLAITIDHFIEAINQPEHFGVERVERRLKPIYSNIYFIKNVIQFSLI